MHAPAGHEPITPAWAPGWPGCWLPLPGELQGPGAGCCFSPRGNRPGTRWISVAPWRGWQALFGPACGFQSLEVASIGVSQRARPSRPQLATGGEVLAKGGHGRQTPPSRSMRSGLGRVVSGLPGSAISRRLDPLQPWWSASGIEGAKAFNVIADQTCACSEPSLVSTPPCTPSCRADERQPSSQSAAATAVRQGALTAALHHPFTTTRLTGPGGRGGRDAAWKPSRYRLEQPSLGGGGFRRTAFRAASARCFPSGGGRSSGMRPRHNGSFNPDERLAWAWGEGLALSLLLMDGGGRFEIPLPADSSPAGPLAAPLLILLAMISLLAALTASASLRLFPPWYRFWP